MRRSPLDPSRIHNAEKLSQPHAWLEFAPEPKGLPRRLHFLFLAARLITRERERILGNRHLHCLGSRVC